MAIHTIHSVKINIDVDDWDHSGDAERAEELLAMSLAELPDDHFSHLVIYLLNDDLHGFEQLINPITQRIYNTVFDDYATVPQSGHNLTFELVKS